MYNHKPENHVKQSIKYTNFKREASTFFKDRKTTPFAWKPSPQNKKSTFYNAPPELTRKPTQKNWAEICMSVF